jgi:nitrous oxidase accessory protein NosD
VTEIKEGAMTGAFHRRVFVAVTAGLLAVSLAGPARASTSTTIEVFPGSNAIRTALQQANPGDTLDIHAGAYPETIVVNKNGIRFQSAGDGPVTVDGGCNGSTFEVNSNGVQLVGLSIIGGRFYNVDFDTVSNGVASDNRLRRTCPNTEYGINLFRTGAMTIQNNVAIGFQDAGIYIGLITDTGSGTLLASGNDLHGNDRGMIIEDSTGVSIVAFGNSSHDNANDGIFLHNADGIDVRMNRTMRNGFAGIELDPDSDGNMVRRNQSRGQTYDLANDGGSNNCFLNNQYQTSFGTITC